MAARYGGEEFAIILPNCAQDKAMEIAKIVAQKVFALEIDHPFSSFGYVSVSIGISTMVPTESSSLNVLLKNADEALYRAKESGRNQCSN